MARQNDFAHSDGPNVKGVHPHHALQLHQTRIHLFQTAMGVPTAEREGGCTVERSMGVSTVRNTATKKVEYLGGVPRKCSTFVQYKEREVATDLVRVDVARGALHKDVDDVAEHAERGRQHQGREQERADEVNDLPACTRTVTAHRRCTIEKHRARCCRCSPGPCRSTIFLVEPDEQWGHIGSDITLKQTNGARLVQHSL